VTPCYYTDAAQTTVYRSGTLDLSSNAVELSASGYRLPCEAEWKYAARGGLRDARFAFGATIAHTQANYFSTTPNQAYDSAPRAAGIRIMNAGAQPLAPARAARCRDKAMDCLR
jgi:formylglycine-generating enzyme required for sulfatase activity